VDAAGLCSVIGFVAELTLLNRQDYSRERSTAARTRGLRRP
jgi:hypothetical protein